MDDSANADLAASFPLAQHLLPWALWLAAHRPTLQQLGVSAGLQSALEESESLHGAIWSVVEQAARGSTANATLASLIASANEVIDLHELRLSSLQNHLPSALFYMLLSLASVSIASLAWSFGAASHRGRTPMVLLALLIGAVLLLIMDVNRPQRGIIEVGVAPLERAMSSSPAE